MKSVRSLMFSFLLLIVTIFYVSDDKNPDIIKEEDREKIIAEWTK